MKIERRVGQTLRFYQIFKELKKEKIIRNVTDFCTKYDIPYNSAAHVLKAKPEKNRYVQEEWITNLAKGLKIGPLWLLEGTGDPPSIKDIANSVNINDNPLRIENKEEEPELYSVKKENEKLRIQNNTLLNDFIRVSNRNRELLEELLVFYKGLGGESKSTPDKGA